MWKPFRKIKFEYIKILRMKGAPSLVALGFGIGIFLEFITIPTFGLAFLLIYPLNRLFGSSLSASLIGYVIGKIALPLFMLPNLKLGNAIIGKNIVAGHAPPEGWRALLKWLKTHEIAYLTGSFVIGICVAIASYGIIYGSLQWYRKKRSNRQSTV